MFVFSIADSPHLPTGPQAAGKNQQGRVEKEEAPFHVPTRIKDSQTGAGSSDEKVNSKLYKIQLGFIVDPHITIN